MRGHNPGKRLIQRFPTRRFGVIYEARPNVTIEIATLALKTSNDFNEQWNIYASSGFVRRRYVTTCLPSWF
jgi:hypothetical protein